MPRNTRQWAHRKLNEACNSLDWAATHVQAVVVVYRQDHPEIADPLSAVMSAMAAVSQEIQNIKRSF